MLSKDSKMENKTLISERPLIFTGDFAEEDDRIDCAWHNPLTEKTLLSLKRSSGKSRKMVLLKKLADVKGGKRLPTGTVLEDADENVVPYIRVGDIHDLEIHPSEASKISKIIHQEIQNYQLKKNDIGITIVGTIGKVGMLREDVEVCDFSENLAKIHVIHPDIDPDFILHYLDSDIGRLQTEQFSVGSLQFKLSLSSCKNIEVFVPFDADKQTYDLDRQKKMTDEVRTLLQKSREVLQKRNSVIKSMDAILQEEIGIPLDQFDGNQSNIYCVDLTPVSGGRIDALYSNPQREKLLNLISKQPHVPLSALAAPDEKSALKPRDFYNLVELEELDADTGRILRSRETPELGSEKIILNANSIIIAKLQPEGGKVAIVTEEFDGCVGSSEFIPIVLTSNEVSLDYLWAILHSKYISSQWKYEVTGSSRMRIGPKEIFGTLIPIPDKSVREKIVERIHAALASADAYAMEANDLCQKARELFSSMLHS